MLNVSTKTGDKGKTSLANGERLSKGDVIFELLGSLDELNSWLGIIISYLKAKHELSPGLNSELKYLFKLQKDIFVISAELARSPKVKLKKSQLTRLEKNSSKLQKSMEAEWTAKFIYPGGTLIAAHIDVTRTVCRRFERTLFSYAQQEQVNQYLLSYINRLSDYLYVLRCFVNQEQGYQDKKFIA